MNIIWYVVLGILSPAILLGYGIFSFFYRFAYGNITKAVRKSKMKSAKERSHSEEAASPGIPAANV